jgi:calcium binding protein 39
MASGKAGAGEAGGGGEGGVGVKAAKEGKRAVVVVAPDPATSSGLAEGDMDVAAKVAALVVGDARESAAVATDEVKCTTTVQQLAKNGGDLLTYLVSRYDDAEIALNSGAMLRECIRNETLAQLLLETNVFWRFFELVEKSDFDVASDAFTSFKAALTQHHAVAATFMLSCLERFVEQYNGLLRSSNYYTRRQSLKLLGEMLMQRANFKIMTRYISSPENLKLVMNLLLDSRKNIQFEAFHVFKVFVANPNKPAEVRQILLRNKVKMTEYLSDFLIDRDDEQFHVDRRQILEEIKALT